MITRTYHDADGCHWGGRPHTGACRDRSRESGQALTDVRSILSRATATLKAFVDSAVNDQPMERERDQPPNAPVGVAISNGPAPVISHRAPFHDPDLAAMIQALRQVIGLLQPWKRAGTTDRWVTDQPVGELLLPAAPTELYVDEVGDEMFMGVQGAVEQLRDWLAARTAWDPNVQRTVVTAVDDWMRVQVAEQGDDDEDGEPE